MLRTKYITVNRGVIDRNRRRGLSDPPVRVGHGKHGRVEYGNVVEILSQDGTAVIARFVYNTANPLPHGARVWVETIAPVRVVA